MVKKYALIEFGGDYEIYLVDNQRFKVVWGYATGSDTGLHNVFNTDVCVYQWGDDWEPVHGFNLLTDKEGNVDWGDYEKKVDEVLTWI